MMTREEIIEQPVAEQVASSNKIRNDHKILDDLLNNEFDIDAYDVFKEEVFIGMIDSINLKIKISNKGKPKSEQEEYLNKEYLLNRYRKIRRKQEIQEFRELHECKYCTRYRGTDSCKAVDRCPFDDEYHADYKVEDRYCSKHPDGRCPYAGENGTCVGFCMLDILNVMGKQKRQYAKEVQDG